MARDVGKQHVTSLSGAGKGQGLAHARDGGVLD